MKEIRNIKIKFFVVFILLNAVVQAQPMVVSKIRVRKPNYTEPFNSKAAQYNLGNKYNVKDTIAKSGISGGWYLRYERGWVYQNPKEQNCFAIWGEMQLKWAEQNYEYGWLGFPKSDYTATPKRNGGVFQHFDGGSIYYSKHTGAHFMKGWFMDYWGKLGWENSKELGFPTSDEYGIDVEGYQIAQNFEFGSLFVGLNKPIIYTSNPNAKVPTQEEILKFNPPPVSIIRKRKSKESENFELFFKAAYYSNGDPIGPAPDQIDLYGFMDVRLFKNGGFEIADKDGKKYTLFNIVEKDNLADEGKYNSQGFNESNSNFHRRFNLTKTEIEAGAYIRVFYWLHDYDNASGNEHLKLVGDNGRIPYAGVGEVGYREIKVIDILRGKKEDLIKADGRAANKLPFVFQVIDKVVDGSDYLNISYFFELNEK